MIPDVPSREQLEQAGIKILVGVPLGESVCDAAFVGFWEIAKRGYPLIDRLRGRTDINRNVFASALLKSDYTHLCMLDTDHIHQPDVIERLARWAMQCRDRWVIGGLNFKRGEPYSPLVYTQADSGDLIPPLNWEPGLSEVAAIGTGCILVAREAFERLQRPFFAYDYTHAESDLYSSEDLYFSAICREAHIKICCDTTVTSPHLITQGVSEAAFRGWLARHRKE